MTDYGSTNHGSANQRAAVQASLYFAKKRRRKHAESVITFTTKPASGKTVTVGPTVYTFGSSTGQVPIGATLATAVANLFAAMQADVTVGATAFSDTTITAHARARSFGGVGIAVSTDISDASWAPTTLQLPTSIGF